MTVTNRCCSVSVCRDKQLWFTALPRCTRNGVKTLRTERNNSHKNTTLLTLSVRSDIPHVDTSPTMFIFTGFSSNYSSFPYLLLGFNTQGLASSSVQGIILVTNEGQYTTPSGLCETPCSIPYGDPSRTFGVRVGRRQ